MDWFMYACGLGLVASGFWIGGVIGYAAGRRSVHNEISRLPVAMPKPVQQAADRLAKKEPYQLTEEDRILLDEYLDDWRISK